MFAMINYSKKRGKWRPVFMDFTHFDEKGRALMVDVTEKMRRRGVRLQQEGFLSAAESMRRSRKEPSEREMF